jgi:hypothetical protein
LGVVLWGGAEEEEEAAVAEAACEEMSWRKSEESIASR